MRVVLDTNVFVSGVLGGALAEVITRWQAGEFTVVVSDEIAREYLEVLRRPKFGLPAEVIDDIGAYLLQNADFVTPTEVLHVVPDDPEDDKFIEAAVAGEAELLVSGDRHLLALRNYQDLSIVTARDFLERLASSSGGA